ncbi:GUN4 domain-containing protein [Phormidesmis sp. 146-20]
MKSSIGFSIVSLGTIASICLSNGLVAHVEAQTSKGVLTSQPILVSQADKPKPTVESSPIVQPTPESAPSNQPSDKPSTEQVDDDPFKELKQALEQKDFKAADQATYKLMLESAGQKSKEQGRFDQQEWEQFPCSDLQAIDKLWVDSTGGTQGFSVQKKMLIEAKEVPLAYQVRVGWRDASGKWLVTPRYSGSKKTVIYDKEPNFKSPPPGQLPAKFAWWDARDRRFERIYACKL